MKDITPARAFRTWRRPVGKAMPWDCVCSEIGHVVAFHLSYTPLLQLVTLVARSPAAAELYSTYSLSGWIITDSAELHWNDNILFIRYEPEKMQFEFEHRTLAEHDDIQRCSESDAVSMLSLFLRYKFGVILDPKPRA